MANWAKRSVLVMFLDGTETVHEYVGGCVGGVDVQDGTLHLTVKDGDFAPLTHVASYPLTAIRSYHVRGGEPR